AVWVVDTKKEHIAVSEARKLGIPVVAILDTNCDPDEVSYPIPGNDDAIRSVALLTRVVADAVADGLIARAGAADGDQKPSDDEFSSEEPLPEWERDLLAGPATAGAPDTAGVPDTADAADSAAETVDVAGTAADTVDTAGAADTAADTVDTADTAETVDTADSADTAADTV